MSYCQLTGAFTQEERDALGKYGAESTYFHAAHQGRGEELSTHPEYTTFLQNSAGWLVQIDSALSKSTLRTDKVLYSGHGKGWGIRGSLTGDPAKFIGLTYRYAGYISTSAVEIKAVESFLAKTANPGSFATLLELRLPAGFPAVDMNDAGVQGEFELLLGRGHPFEIVDASEFQNPEVPTSILRLVLKPRA